MCCRKRKQWLINPTECGMGTWREQRRGDNAKSGKIEIMQKIEVFK